MTDKKKSGNTSTGKKAGIGKTENRDRTGASKGGGKTVGKGIGGKKKG